VSYFREAEVSWILFVEDNKDLRHVVTELLRTHGHDIQSASDGEEALALLAGREPPFLIITDLHMPVMTGWELIDHIRADPRLVRVPLAVASSEEVPVPGVRYQLTKPYLVNDVLQLVECFAVARRPTGTG
jgi:CheY-like chemotaxis protein